MLLISASFRRGRAKTIFLCVVACRRKERNRSPRYGDVDLEHRPSRFLRSKRNWWTPPVTLGTFCSRLECQAPIQDKRCASGNSGSPVCQCVLDFGGSIEASPTHTVPLPPSAQRGRSQASEGRHTNRRECEVVLLVSELDPQTFAKCRIRAAGTFAIEVQAFAGPLRSLGVARFHTSSKISAAI